MACALAGALFACDSRLDFEPAQSIDETLALGSSDNVKSVLVGAYDEMGNGSGLGGNALRNSELMADNGELSWAGTFAGPREIFNKAISVENFDVSDFWLDTYNTINITNNVLSALEVVDESDRGIVEGEALFIRSFLYFELVKYYAQPYSAGSTSSNLGVPLVLTPTRSAGAELQVPRNTVEECYQQIIADLQSAASLLPASNGFFATSGAAKALLSRVYLQTGNYQGARDLANEVINSGDYALVDSYAGAFNNGTNTSEDIFAAQVTAQDGVNNMFTFFGSVDVGGRGDIPITQIHLDLYEDGDERLAMFFEEAGELWSGKWTNQVNNNVNLIRLAEMHLTRAECNSRLGSSIGATPLEDINMIRSRAGLADVASVTLDDILLERRLELAHEGHRLHDAKRLQETIDGLPYNDNSLVFPIPQREMLANLELVQNAGY